MTNFIYGKQIIKYLLKNNPKKIVKIYLKSQNDLDSELLQKYKIPVTYWTLDEFKKNFPKHNHQGMAAEIKSFEYYSWKAFYSYLEKKPAEKTPQLILLLDHIEDPGNFGAICRIAMATSVLAIIVAKNHQAIVNHHVIKASAGYAFGLKIIQVSNLINVIQKLQTLDFWSITSEMNGQSLYETKDLQDQNLLLIVGNEHDGVRPLISKTADWNLSLPMKGVESLNVSNATALFLYHLRNLQKFW